MFSIFRRVFNFVIGEETDCKHVTGSNYCPECGKQLKAKPLDSETLFADFSAFWLRRGFRHTVFGLFARPGRSLRTYLRNDRNFLIRPILYLSITAVFAIWALQKSAALAECGGPEQDPCDMLERYPLFIQFAQAIVFALVFRFVFFRKSGWNIWEMTTVMTYLLAQGFIITGLFAMIEWSGVIQLPIWTGMLVRNLYHLFALVLFLEVRTLGKFLLTLVAFFLAFALALVMLVGLVSLEEFWPALVNAGNGIA